MENGSTRYTYPKGEKNPKSKLRADYIPIIISLRFDFGWSLSDIGTFLGVAHVTIQHVLRGRTWQHITNPIFDSMKHRRIAARKRSVLLAR